ncbi:MAG: two-component system, OmpR family, sensor histidine kinase KdpD, partial [Thermomicrobiales bacterium]|nr:two-component system, OmpR family, sensor histidine kinase KdpD [Thermomicrobiales bacterium]
MSGSPGFSCPPRRVLETPGSSPGSPQKRSPVRILDDATEVQLVDLPVEGLLERLEQGKVYPAERASQALEHFFRP